MLAAFGSTGDGADQLKSPQGLAATPAGEWVVADSGHGLVKVFDLAGSLLRSFGELGGGAGEFVQLDDVAVDAAGLVYTSDSFQDWLQVWNPDGSLREVLGTYGGGVGPVQDRQPAWRPPTPSAGCWGRRSTPRGSRSFAPRTTMSGAGCRSRQRPAVDRLS